MTSRESPRAALTRAEYFLGRAAALHGDRRAEFEHNIDAAIVFGRSAYHFLQARAKATGADPGFVAWFNTKRTTMLTDVVLEYFRKERDMTLKERHRAIPKRVFATASVAFGISMHAEGVVSRAQPWYRRSPSILWQDARASVMRPLRRCRYRTEVRVARVKRTLGERRDRLREQWRARRYVPSVREFYLDDPEGLNRPAVDLVREYLARLDAIIAEAEASFPMSVA